jgi:hypothetical protein
MPKYLIEVPHDAEKRECALAIQAFMKTGSPFMSQVDWGCSDGEHKAWIIIEVENKKDAYYIVPPAYRSRAKIVKLTKYTIAEIENVLEHHD